jgi:hypothetical protein
MRASKAAINNALSDSFAKAGLRALKAIEGEQASSNPTKPNEDSSSETLAMDIILSTSVKAETNDENGLSLLLAILHANKQMVILDQKLLRDTSKTDPDADITMKKLIASIREGNKKQNACNAALNAIFRTRNSNAMPVAVCLSNVE